MTDTIKGILVDAYKRTIEEVLFPMPADDGRLFDEGEAKRIVFDPDWQFGLSFERASVKNVCVMVLTPYWHDPEYQPIGVGPLCVVEDDESGEFFIDGRGIIFGLFKPITVEQVREAARFMDEWAEEAEAEAEA